MLSKRSLLPFLVGAFCLLGAGRALKAESELQVEYNPRLDIWQNEAPIKQELYGRLAIDGHSKRGKTSFRGRAEGFATYDFAEQEMKPLGNPDLRQSRNEADLSEAWLDVNREFSNSAFGLRLGRQPIRWSQSWTLPSLDYFTGRRINRLFYDPLLDQLTHPDAARLTLSGSILGHAFETEAVRVYGSSPYRYPTPLTSLNRDRQDDHDHGLKMSTKLGGMDVAIMGRDNDRETAYGMSASYAFEDYVLKVETGQSSRHSEFGILGVDWFLSKFTLGPQVTVYKDPALSTSGSEGLFYFPVRFTQEKWTIEAEGLVFFGAPEAAKDRFNSVRIGLEVIEGGTLSVAAQEYRGSKGRALGLSESLSGGSVVGLRFDYNGGFTK